MTRAELLALPASVGVEVAFRAIGVGRSKGYEMLRADELPFQVLRLGSTYRVPTAPLLTLLGIDKDEIPAPLPTVALEQSARCWTITLTVTCARCGKSATFARQAAGVGVIGAETVNSGREAGWTIPHGGHPVDLCPTCSVEEASN